MVNMTASLGRPVISPNQLIDIIRPQLRMMRACFRGCVEASRSGLIAYEHVAPDDRVSATGFQGDDAKTFRKVHQFLREDAQATVKQWAGEHGVVFDGEKVKAFIFEAMDEALRLEGEMDDLPFNAFHLI